MRVYCLARNIPTENIRLSQNNIVDPENRYNQIFKIQVELPEDISEKDREGKDLPLEQTIANMFSKPAAVYVKTSPI
nr:hypothetical protein [Halomonas desiderata]